MKNSVGSVSASNAIPTEAIWHAQNKFSPSPWWSNKWGPLSSMMQAQKLLQLAKRDKAMLTNEEMKSVAISVVELCLSKGISYIN